jgi:DNA polymerase elongation subunit (family B)
MIQHDLLTRQSEEPELFTEIYNKRVELKKAGKKDEQAPYKIILNSTFGITNQEYSKAYDPQRNHDVCINGQLMLLMLLEMLEGTCELIQSNTDGIIVDCTGYDQKRVKKSDTSGRGSQRWDCPLNRWTKSGRRT